MLKNILKPLVIIVFSLTIFLVSSKNLLATYLIDNENIVEETSSLKLNDREVEEIKKIMDITIERKKIEEKPKSILEKYSKIIFIGDSRTVGLSQAIDNDLDIEFICEVGKGLTWIKEQEIEKFIEDKNNLVLINLGVNDLYNCSNYVRFFSNLNKYNNICYVSIYPVDEEKEECYGYSVRNVDIENFNSTMKENFNYIDVYSILNEEGFETRDGIHYKEVTYKKIYNEIVNFLKL